MADRFFKTTIKVNQSSEMQAFYPRTAGGDACAPRAGVPLTENVQTPDSESVFKILGADLANLVVNGVVHARKNRAVAQSGRQAWNK